jgi:hypothetical protein
VREIVVVFVIVVRVILVLLGFVVLLNVDEEELMLCDKVDFSVGVVIGIVAVFVIVVIVILVLLGCVVLLNVDEELMLGDEGDFCVGVEVEFLPYSFSLNFCNNEGNQCVELANEFFNCSKKVDIGKDSEG